MAYANMTGIVMSAGPSDIMKILYGPVPGPLPCINTAFFMMAVPPVPVIIADGLPAVNIMAVVVISPIADEPGFLLGVISEMMIGLAKLLSGMPTVLALGMPMAVEGLTAGISNVVNTPVDLIVVMQFTWMM